MEKRILDNDRISQQVLAQVEEIESLQNIVDDEPGFFMKAGRNFPYSYLHGEVGAERAGKRAECILAEKVINECFLTECPIILRTHIPGVESIEDCQIIFVKLLKVSVPEDDVVELNFRFVLKIEVNTDFKVFRVVDFTKRIALEGADRDAFRQRVQKIRVFRFAQCLGCRIIDDDTVECEIGLFALVKITTLAQLLVDAEFCPMPPECVQLSPIGCPEFLERAERGDFMPPVPRQFFP
ncbi:MAG: hypothetical protein GX030_00445 [Firmicutes bacterium]|nr:hypothetical protein [Bacillota bacterium]